MNLVEAIIMQFNVSAQDSEKVLMLMIRQILILILILTPIPTLVLVLTLTMTQGEFRQQDVKLNIPNNYMRNLTLLVFRHGDTNGNDER